ncbi:MAG: glycosyltransferase family 2 protein [Lachnospiraceae bacterium]
MKKTREYNTNAKPVVSVIIPVYNAEKNLNQMLETVVNQTLKNIEIICVNDGSTDCSAEVIKKFQKNDNRIIYLEQMNLNAGVARNRGLDFAKGKYVVFWDADDKFDKRALELLFEKAEAKKADICVCGVNEFTDEGKIYEADGYLRVDYIPGKDPFNKFDISEYFFDFASNVLWNKLYLRTFLIENDLRFQNIRQANDTAFVMLSLFFAEAITCVNKKLAFYRVNNPNSLTGRSSETVFCPYEAYLYTLQEIKKYPDFLVVQKSFRNKTVKGMFRALNIQTSFESYKELYDFLQKEGMEKLELLECKKEEMEEEWIYNDLEMMKTMSAGDFLISKANERRWDRDQLKYTLRRVRKKLALLLLINEKLKKIKSIMNNRRR